MWSITDKYLEKKCNFAIFNDILKTKLDIYANIANYFKHYTAKKNDNKGYQPVV